MLQMGAEAKAHCLPGYILDLYQQKIQYRLLPNQFKINCYPSCALITKLTYHAKFKLGVLVSFFIAETKYLQRQSLKDVRFALLQRVGRQTSSWCRRHEVRGCLLTSGRLRQQNKMNKGTQVPFFFFTLLFSPRPHSMDSAIFKVGNAHPDMIRSVPFENYKSSQLNNVD